MKDIRHETGRTKPALKGAANILADALIATLFAAVVGVVVNVARPQGLPFIAKEPYDILVPCPEPGGAALAMAVSDPALRADNTFLVDARSAQAFESWRFRDAANVAFDYLDPTPEAQILALAQAIAKSRAIRVVVYGDGEVPDTGEQLGKEISGHGIKNVYYLKGGAKALQAAEASGGHR